MGSRGEEEARTARVPTNAKLVAGFDAPQRLAQRAQPVNTLVEDERVPDDKRRNTRLGGDVVELGGDWIEILKCSKC